MTKRKGVPLEPEDVLSDYTDRFMQAIREDPDLSPEKLKDALKANLQATRLVGKAGVKHPDYRERRESVETLAAFAGYPKPTKLEVKLGSKAPIRVSMDFSAGGDEADSNGSEE